MNPEILLRNRFEGTTACQLIRLALIARDGYTHDFIDDPLVGVEVEGEAGVAAFPSILGLPVGANTHYFSIRTREALLTVFVRTRPYDL